MKDNQPSEERPLSGLTPEMMEGYIKGTLSPQLMRKVSTYLAENPFEAEAMAGLKSQPTDLSEDLSDLEYRLEKRTSAATRPKYFWPVAASIALLVLSGVVFYVIFPPQQSGNIAVHLDSSVVAPSQPTISDTLGNEVNRSSDDLITSDDLVTSLSESSEQQPIEETVQEVIADEPEQEVIAAESRAQAALPKTQADDLSVSNLPLKTENAKPPEAAPATLPSEKQLVVVGKVTSATSGNPLAGVSVAIKDTEIDTYSDENGFFHLEAPSSSESIITSTYGYRSEEVPIRDSPQINISLEEQTQAPGKAKSYDSRARKKDIIQSPVAATETQDTAPLNMPAAQAPEGIDNYLKDHLEYPKSAREKGIEGSVVVRFVVAVDGSLKNFEIIKKLGYGCEEELIKALLNGPPWNATTIDGVPQPSKGEITAQFPPP